MDVESFRRYAHELVDWMADYAANVENLPVMSGVAPGETLSRLDSAPPEQGEPFERIMADFESVIMPGMTHWQSPNYFAYFNANNSFPSILAEMLTATLGAQCMSWVTSPAATELEERVMEWLREMIGLPREFTGVIQDSASTATLCALLTAREKASGWAINRHGFCKEQFTVYCSREAHSSIEKDVRIAGIGSHRLRRIALNEDFAMDPAALEAAVNADIDEGYKPLAVVAALGTTGSTAIDPLDAIAAVCRRHGLWLHVDAAYAGTALILPSMRWMLKGIEAVDSFVFNPHKWMFTNFDCSAYFVRDPNALVNTFTLLPEYLKTSVDGSVTNYRDWGIQLGRRFRALKLWFVIREYGVQGLRETVASHIRWAGEIADDIRREADFELMAPTPLATVCFRYHPQGVDDAEKLDQINQRLMDALNTSGKLFLTHTKLNGKMTLRLVVGQTRQERRHVVAAWEIIKRTARGSVHS
ncbi:MAG: aminotransferase class I/II-fold pyridoxal phosphate-dependent enzyme [Acidobacteriota bacterium]|nr:aminotransferase class I/II-fold pyridoxal phosphate-dependent enzyme [Acidobacteriota bacterium]